MFTEPQIKKRQFSKDIDRHLMAEKNCPAVKKMFCAFGIPGVVYQCNTCFYLKTKNCDGMDCLADVCKEWFGPHLKDQNDWIPLEFQKKKSRARFRNGNETRLFRL